MFPNFVAKNIATECGDKHSLAVACKGVAKAREMTIWNMRVMTRQARSNYLKSKECIPQYGHMGCKAVLVTVPRVNQE